MTGTLVLLVELAIALWAASEWLRTLGHRQGLDPAGWVLAALAVVFLSASTLVRLAPIVVGHPLEPSRAASELLGAGWGLMCALVSARLAFRIAQQHRPRFWLDTFMVTAALLAVGWSTILEPVLRSANGSAYASATSLLRASVFTHRLCDLLMIAGLILLCSRLPALRSGSMLLMVTSQLAIFGGNILDGLMNRDAPRSVPSILVELCWTVGLALYAVNGRRMRNVLLLGTQPVRPVTANQLVDRFGLTLPYLPLVGFVILACVRAVRHTAWSPAETWLAIIACLLVCCRQMLVLYDNRRLLVAVGEREQRLEYQAFHDPLTGLPNRALFGQQLAAATSELPSAGDLALLFCDLDDFKRVNDHLGHSAGDRLLCIAAERLSSCAPQGALVARLGGDEFAVLLTGASDANADADARITPRAVATRIMEAFREPADLDGEPLLVIVSIGIGEVAAGEIASAEELLTRADLAMLAAKKQGKGRFATFDPAMKPADLHDRSLVNDFAAALRAGELYPVYQPIVDLASGAVIGVEALARWDHPTLGAVSPHQFIQLAETTGLIGALTNHLLRAVASDHAAWRRAGIPAPYLSVNIAPSLLRRREFQLAIHAVIGAGLPAEMLVLEVTDTDTVSDEPAVDRMLGELRRRGVRIALDDFGIGNHSLTNLRRLPVDMIKIDRSILAGAGLSQRDDALMAGYIDLGRRLNLDVVAVGIERQEVVTRLLELGCLTGQGHFFSAPLMRDDMTKRLLLDASSAPVSAVPEPRPPAQGITRH